MGLVARIAVAASTYHIDKPYDYLIPPESESLAVPGRRVLVPFGRGNKNSEAVILSLETNSMHEKLKTVTSFIDDEPVFNEENLRLALWMSDRFFCTVYDALKAMLPAKMTSRRRANIKTSVGIGNISNINADMVLSNEQKYVFDNLLPLLRDKSPQAALLSGVTGSGKTFVYIKLIEEVLSLNKTAIVLVPEIALTPQTVKIFASHFGDEVAVLHSALGSGERFEEWKRIRDGNVRVVVGTRSAVFAPLKDIGLIVIDEEQEHTYKSESSPRYHAREVAKYRVTRTCGLLLLASATPSIESMYFAKNGIYKFFHLKSRFNRKELPPVICVDMKKELKSGYGGLISSVLQAEIEKNLQNDEQCILFINRRGASPLVACGECGFTYKCKHCSVSMTYHISNKRLLCHYCGYSLSAPSSCPDCLGKLKFIGAGTQKIELELLELFPDVGIIRMDADTTTRKNSHNRLLSDFRKRKAQILLGTQMVTKGLDFENVTLVGVLSADLSLYMSDFRANEKTFSLITQVVGRSGRGGKQGRAVIQTFTPEHNVIKLASRQDFDGFYESEITLRNALGSPPIKDLIAVTAVGADENAVVSVCKGLKIVLSSYFKGNSQVRLLGPAPANVSKVSNKYRYRLLVSCTNNKRVRETIAHVLREFSKDKRSRGVMINADADFYE